MLKNISTWAFGQDNEKQNLKRDMEVLKEDVATMKSDIKAVTEDVKDVQQHVQRIDAYLIKANIVFSGDNVANVVKNRPPEDALKYFLNCFEPQDLTEDAMKQKMDVEVENYHPLKRGTEFIVRFKKLAEPSTYHNIISGNVACRFDAVYARKQETRVTEKMKYLQRKMKVQGDIIGCTINPMTIQTPKGTFEIETVADLYRHMSERTKAIVTEDQRKWNERRQRQLTDFVSHRRETYAKVLKQQKMKNPNFQQPGRLDWSEESAQAPKKAPSALPPNAPERIESPKAQPVLPGTSKARE